MLLRVLVFVLYCLVSTSVAITFTKCEMVYELRRQGFAEYLIKDLICLIEESSVFRSHVVTGPYQDESYDWGLFQINDQHWCNNGPYPGKFCNVRCIDLLLDDITLSSACAKTMLKQQGLNAWPVWVNFCSGYRLPDYQC